MLRSRSIRSSPCTARCRQRLRSEPGTIPAGSSAASASRSVSPRTWRTTRVLGGEKHKQEGEKFLAENGKKPGVVTLASGLQDKLITEGTGKTPTATSTVTTQYSGRLIDGTEFDSSYKRGQPATFPCNGVLRGWTEALQLMKEGSKWELCIPSDLAYGESGAGGIIPPGATLIFQVELISVK